jgi:hypothetical protein
MVPPSYYQSQQQYNQPQNGVNYVPPYNPTPGRGDAGYYDQHGNFVVHDNNIPMNNTNAPPTSSANPNGYQAPNYPPPAFQKN